MNGGGCPGCGGRDGEHTFHEGFAFCEYAGERSTFVNAATGERMTWDQAALRTGGDP